METKREKSEREQTVMQEKAFVCLNTLKNNT